MFPPGVPTLDQINLVLFVFSLFLYIAKELCTYFIQDLKIHVFEGFLGKNYRGIFCFSLEKAGKMLKNSCLCVCQENLAR